MDRQIKMKTIEEYNGCHYFLFAHGYEESYVSLLGSAYTMRWIEPLIEKAIETFGDNMTYTLIEKEKN